ncbi:MAG TPA: hypothetical protein VKU87_10725, partial [Thermomicrobiaceae bacterium]|nr:hypothetical protein [Thermomicrobiaceae bacterium]
MDFIDTNDVTETSAADIRRSVKERYGAAALAVQSQSQSEGRAGCCGASSDAAAGPPAVREYDPAALSDLPQEALLASLGCGNPTA